MKKLHKKISCIALVGMMSLGGCLSNRISSFEVYADSKSVKSKKDDQPKLISNPDDIRKYKQNLYGVQLPDSDLFARHNSIYGLLNNDNDKDIKRLKDEINDVCNNNSGKKIEVVYLSSEYNKPGMNSSEEEKHGVNAFLDGLQELLGKDFKGDPNFFNNGGQLFFDDLSDFKMYLEMESEKMESGYVRLQIEKIEGVFRIGSGRAESK